MSASERNRLDVIGNMAQLHEITQRLQQSIPNSKGDWVEERIRVNDTCVWVVRKSLSEIPYLDDITYDLDQIKAYGGKNAAFRDWIYTLQRSDQLPRGKFFKGKKPGSPHFVMDEAWMILNPHIGQAS